MSHCRSLSGPMLTRRAALRGLSSASIVTFVWGLPCAWESLAAKQISSDSVDGLDDFRDRDRGSDRIESDRSTNRLHDKEGPIVDNRLGGSRIENACGGRSQDASLSERACGGEPTADQKGDNQLTRDRDRKTRERFRQAQAGLTASDIDGLNQSANFEDQVKEKVKPSKGRTTLNSLVKDA